MLAASYYDIVARRIPNMLVVVVLAAGLGFAMLSAGPLAFGRALVLVAAGLVIWLPFYALGMLGAGDVKLFAACCAWFASIGQVVLAAAASAVAGGVLAIIWALVQRRTLPVVGALITRVRFKTQMPVDLARAKVPYGLAMAVGILWSVVRVM